MTLNWENRLNIPVLFLLYSAAKIIFGAYHDRRLSKGTIKIILIATGFNSAHQLRDPDRFGLFSMGSDEPLEEGGVAMESENEKKDDESIGEVEERPRRKSKTNGGGIKESESEDIWEIPAFLRRRKRR